MGTLAKVISAIVLAAVASSAHATLIGDTVGGAISGPIGISWPNSTAVVGVGVEFERGTIVDATADFSGDTLTLTYFNNSTFPNITFGAGTFTFTDLDWADPAVFITGLTELANNFPHLPAAGSIVASTGVDSIVIDVPLTNTNPNDLFQVTYRIETQRGDASVPEPTIIALMGLGLAGIGYQRRKQNKAA